MTAQPSAPLALTALELFSGTVVALGWHWGGQVIVLPHAPLAEVDPGIHDTYQEVRDFARYERAVLLAPVFGGSRQGARRYRWALAVGISARQNSHFFCEIVAVRIARRGNSRLALAEDIEAALIQSDFHANTLAVARVDGLVTTHTKSVFSWECGADLYFNDFARFVVQDPVMYQPANTHEPLSVQRPALYDPRGVAFFFTALRRMLCQ